MDLIVIGLNHETAPLEVRENAMLNEQQQTNFLTDLTQQPSIKEAATLLTCNRIEIYYLGQCEQCLKENINSKVCQQALTNSKTCDAIKDSAKTVFNFLQQYSHIHPTHLKPYLYKYKGINMVKHLMQVSSGLNSMILGEPQILGQVKKSYKKALEIGSIQEILTKLFEHTFQSAKKIRTKTEIGKNPISIAYACLTLTKQIFNSLEDKCVLFIGTGEMIKLSSQYFHQSQCKNIIIANRTLKHAQQLASKYSATAVSLNEIQKYMVKADIVISSTNSNQILLDEKDITQSNTLRSGKRQLLIDLAVPRDIAKPSPKLKNIYYYATDNLADIINQSKLKRSNALVEANEIIKQDSQTFMQWLNLQQQQEIIKELRTFGEECANQAVQKALKELKNNQNPEQIIIKLGQQLKNQLMHPASQAIRSAISEQKSEEVTLIKKIYQLNQPLDKENKT